MESGVAGCGGVRGPAPITFLANAGTRPTVRAKIAEGIDHQKMLVQFFRRFAHGGHAYRFADRAHSRDQNNATNLERLFI